ncbi:hypothetical protein E4U54_008502 [Claviceps lovelessii]|nr:hypothetical protein E4U54_008502 [Claviceps lovelessii]
MRRLALITLVLFLFVTLLASPASSNKTSGKICRDWASKGLDECALGCLYDFYTNHLGCSLNYQACVCSPYNLHTLTNSVCLPNQCDELQVGTSTRLLLLKCDKWRAEREQAEKMGHTEHTDKYDQPPSEDWRLAPYEPKPDRPRLEKRRKKKGKHPCETQAAYNPDWSPNWNHEG